MEINLLNSLVEINVTPSNPLPTSENCIRSGAASTRSGLRRLRTETAAIAANDPLNPPTYPVVILGGGVGGLTAATYLGQAGFNPLVIEGPNPGGAIMQSDNVRNWPGEMEIGGAELIEKMHEQAKANGARFQMSEVVDIDTSSQPYVLTLKDIYGNLQHIQAKSVIIAMGTKAKLLGVPGEQEYWTRGVYNCALCDGPLYKDKNVAVAGGANSAIVEALYLSNIAKKVTIFMRGKELRSLDEAMKKELMSRPNIEIRPLTTVESIEGDGERLTQVRIQSNGKSEIVELDALFLAIGSTPNTDIFKGTLDRDDNGYLISSKTKETSAKGIFAIGDVVQNRCKQAICAAGEAAEASLYVSDFLAIKPVKLTALKTSVAAGPEVIDIKSVAQFEQEMKNSNIPIVVDFYATWCPPCKAIAPVYAEFAQTYQGKIKFLKVDTGIVSELSKKYNITSIPTFLFFDHENLVAKMSGANAPLLKQNLEKLLKK